MSIRVYETKKIADDLYVITETESVHCYVILGTTAAVLFDTGYGYESLERMSERSRICRCPWC